MITNDTLTAMYADDRHATITWRNNLHSDREDLEQAYTESNTPAETIDRAAAIMGIDRVREIVASLINVRADYDGRISADAKAWAQTIPGALDAAAAERVRLYSDAIHPAHLDQLARACKDYTPAEPETETAEQTAETAETAQDVERDDRIADIIRDIRASRAPYRTKYRTTAKAIRDAMRAGTPTVALGYCELQCLLGCADPEAYTAGIYGWNFDVYRIGGLTICTGYRGMIGADVDTTAAEKAAAALDRADLDARERMLAEWIYTTLAALIEGARS